MAKFDYYDLNKDDVKNRKDYDYYHSNPEEEALATVLFNFKKFRFENAVKALWKRNALVHLGFGALFLIYSPLILLLKVFRRLPKVKKETSSMTRTYLNYHIVSGNVIKCFSIGISIFLLGIIKLIYQILFGLGWVVIMLMRYIIIPLIRALSGFAIALAIAKKPKKLF